MTGLVGFQLDGNLYLTLFEDANPQTTGADIVRQIRTAIENQTLEFWPELIRKLSFVYEDEIPPLEALNPDSPFAECINAEAINSGDFNWRTVLYECLTNLESLLNRGIWIAAPTEDGRPFYGNYNYILNFDTGVFDVLIRTLNDTNPTQVPSGILSYRIDSLPNWDQGRDFDHFDFVTSTSSRVDDLGSLVSQLSLQS